MKLLPTVFRLGAALTLSALFPFFVGCGSGVSAVIGRNSLAEVSITSVHVNDLDLIISPKEGTATNPGACRDDQEAFGCVRVFITDKTTISFTTNSEASSSPYYVYIRNQGASTRTVTLEIRMDGDRKVFKTLDVPAGTTNRYARIFRNNADDQ
jgi:hypothetical protein